MKVMFNKEKQRVPIKIWTDLESVEPAAMTQLENISRLPFMFKHVAVMPDVHLGKGATVGSVLATKDAIVPAAVGVDIGCGMMAIKTNLNTDLIQDDVKNVRSDIESVCPVGFRSNADVTNEVYCWNGWGSWGNLSFTDMKLLNRAELQIGTLGGGNHFIELCTDTECNVWIMLHSGSRNIGKTLAERHINEAKGLMKKLFIDLPDPDLAYFVSNTKEFDNYWHDLDWCQKYAFRNRIELMRKIIGVLTKRFGEFEKLIEINCHHNYSSLENHYGENVFVTRKGAVRARKGEYGIIPGSMGTRSYIVKGKGVAESFCSCSHGAGRRMSRKEAKRRFTESDFIQQTKGVECRKDSKLIDEIPGAYKDIDKVMEDQSDLVEIVATLKQFVCVKG